ncbi:unnamed protein product [Ambrosiozyma monospora]|uniref:Unnamed protein product n=1 Tax=Ambrosiozyma monospora TaxID=43982 RepID=A0ACB5T2X8_AMBMO|nr:unnamed protein product [Ambrosiozyma monospora]
MFVPLTNMEDYKSKFRPLISHWVSEMKKSRETMANVAYFIILHEDTENRSAADKFLRTSILSKTRRDFSDDELTIEHIFKIKSLYDTDEDRDEAWNPLMASIKTSLSESISIKLDHYLSHPKQLDSLLGAAGFYAQIGQFDGALKCYSNLLQRIGNVGYKSGFYEVPVEDYPLINNPAHIDLKSSPTKFQLKSFFYKSQVDILLTPAGPDSLVLRNLIEIARKMLDFLNSIQDSYKKNEMAYLMIQDYLQHSKVRNMIQQKEKNLTEFFEALGDLKLLKRNELINLSKIKNYRIKGSMVDVSFKEQPKHSEGYQLVSDGAQDMFQTEEHFQIEIIEQTKDIITCYSASQFKQNTVDGLSTELALMTCYNLKLVTSTSSTTNDLSLDALNTSFEYYRNLNWKYISLSILQVYIDNLRHFIETYGASIVPDLMCSYLELVSQHDYFDKHKFSGLLTKVDAILSEKTKDDPDDEGLLVENDNLFEVEIEPYLMNATPDEYYININMKSKICYDVDRICLLLVDKEEDIVEFTVDNITLDKDNSIKVYSKAVITGEFRVARLVVEIGQLKIFKNLDFMVSVFQIKSFFNENNELLNNTYVDVSIPRTRNLHKDELLVSVDVGSKPLTNCQLVFFKTEIDRLVPDSEYAITIDGKNIDFNSMHNDKLLMFGIDQSIDTGSRVELKIPYFFPPDVSATKLKLKFGLLFNDEDYSKTVYKELNTALPIAVSVQDIFKASDLFSNFTINGTSVGCPVRIQKVDLISTNSVVKKWNQPTDVIAYSDQASNFFYKIERIADPSLDLIIDYNDINTEIISILKKLFFEKLRTENKDLIRYFNIAEEIFNCLDFKLNFYTLTNKILILNFSLAEYTTYLQRIDPAHLPSFIRILSQFIKAHEFQVSKELKAESLKETRQTLVINVSLPVINTINTIEFKFNKKLQYLVCDPIKVRMNLSVLVFKMPANEGKKVRFMNDPEMPTKVDIKIEFMENEPNWLIAGLKEFVVPLNLGQNNSSFDFDLIMIPLKAGKLELPKVSVRNLTGGFKLQMELDYKNSSESLLVVSELNKVMYSF